MYMASEVEKGGNRKGCFILYNIYFISGRDWTFSIRDFSTPGTERCGNPRKKLLTTSSVRRMNQIIFKSGLKLYISAQTESGQRGIRRISECVLRTQGGIYCDLLHIEIGG